ncbi:MAG: hypothetical protein HPY89_05220 [Pelotomaculum sp.]|uniref:Hypothetical membrane protein n=1 Tax=Pelotomaculum thermopropionicum (strain DSM 13744 / JCM 10971 / SI) TaxID=370438 RepID=A5CYH5_PELTS|nr:hypothetical protein [Pelotomaculum sp.]BAF60958.1 hypothetical membrane protein [Pelotomaculum thermopropionicum SI]
MRLNKAKTAIMLLIAGAVLSLLGYAAFAGDGEPGGSGDPLVTQSYVDQYVQWRVAELKSGQVLKGGAGTEIIVRRGQAAVVDSTGNGIPDLTAGADIYGGSTVPVNHLLLVPREDGRGVKALSPVVVMYRGEATIR